MSIICARKILYNIMLAFKETYTEKVSNVLSVFFSIRRRGKYLNLKLKIINEI